MKGREIGGYSLQDPIGRGGMGVIYRAVHPATGKAVAVKMLHPRLTRDESVRERFLREAQAQARLSHPNITEIRSLVETDGNYHIIMEFLEGETLLSRLKRSGPLPPETGLPIFRQVLGAVSHAHGLGVLHRDLKPANVMMLPNDTVKVMDFGTAKIVGAESLTLAGTAIGSPLYMSPEQLCGDELDPASDVYALGITLYQMCTGKVPYEGESLADLIRHLRDDSPAPPSRHLPTIDPPLETIILKAIAKVKEERYPTANALREALDTYREAVSRPGGPMGETGPIAPTRAVIPIGPVVLLVPVLALAAVLLPLVFSARMVLGAIALVILGTVSWGLRRSPGSLHCKRCGRVMEPDWRKCLFCERGLPPPDLRVVLLGRDPRGRPSFWPIPEGTVVLGRKAPSQIILEDEEVSNRHGEIRHREGKIHLVDLGSTNGTQVNGVALKADRPIPIYDGDRIALGKTILTVKVRP